MKGRGFILKEYREFCKSRNKEIEYCTPRLHTGKSDTIFKNLMLTNLEEGIELTESVNRALRVLRFTIHTGLKRTPFELHRIRKPRTELTNIVKDGKTYRIGQKYFFQHQISQKSLYMWAVTRMARLQTTWSWQGP